MPDPAPPIVSEMPPKKKKSWGKRILTFLMYGWMLVAILIIGIVIWISTCLSHR